MSKEEMTLRKRIYAAALIHDIGKFSQRADQDGDILPTVFSGNEAIYCPQHPEYGYFSHRHVLYTAAFIEEFGLTNAYADNNEKRDNLLNLAAAHHKPSTFLQSLIQRADWYASGMDRSSRTAFKDAELEHDQQRYRKTRMCSVFELIGRGASEDGAWKYRLPLEKLDLSDTRFPKELSAFDTGPDYPALWQEFKTEVKMLDKDHPDSFFGSLYYLLERFTSAIPSTTMHLPDVSLFDHSKVTAAFAVALYDYLHAEKRLDDNWKAPTNDEEPFLLYGGDISGIQSYIYGIISKYAAKNLKGRSFYLEFLNDAILREILKETSLFESNIIYSSGGRFYLLLPNTEAIRKKLDSLQMRLEKAIFNTHGLRLYLSMAYIPLSVGCIMNDSASSQSISSAWRELGEELNARKRQRYKSIILSDPRFFEPRGRGGEVLRDVLTGEELQGRGAVLASDEESEIRVNPFTEKLIELGKMLKDVDFWVVSPSAISYWENERNILKFQLFEDAHHHYFLSKKTLDRVKDRLKASADDVFIRSFNQLYYQADIRGRNVVQGFILYAGNSYPVISEQDMMNPEIAAEGEAGDPKTFDMLAASGAFHKLGVLRMDVDGLGQIFINGIPENMRTFSRYAVLSRSLDFYFKGYLNTIWREGKSRAGRSFAESTFIIYAGGDDLFVVGYWADIIEMAERIYSDFRRYSCNNPLITLSGGMAMVDSKYPIYRAAEEAAAEEEYAKRHRWPKDEKTCETDADGIKDSFSFLSRPVNWHSEWPELLKLTLRLEEGVKEKVLPRSLLQRLQRYAEEAHKDDRSRAPGRWRWMMSYDLKRMKDRLKGNEGAMILLSEIQKNALTDSIGGRAFESCYSYLDILQLAARWAEFLTK